MSSTRTEWEICAEVVAYAWYILLHHWSHKHSLILYTNSYYDMGRRNNGSEYSIGEHKHKLPNQIGNQLQRVICQVLEFYSNIMWRY